VGCGLLNGSESSPELSGSRQVTCVLSEGCGPEGKIEQRVQGAVHTRSSAPLALPFSARYHRGPEGGDLRLGGGG
jgi:hypothetical protein